MKEASTEVEELFEGVWKNELLFASKKLQIRTLSL